MFINQYSEGSRINCPLLVVNVSKGVSGNNAAYLTITFQDKTGTIDGKRWDMKPEDEVTFSIGNIVNIEADVIDYRGNLQLKVNSGLLVDKNEVDVSLFVPSSPIPVEELEAKLSTLLESIKDEDVSKIVTTLISTYYKQYISYPAATRNHHEFASGLLHHTLTMAALADQVCLTYPELDRDMLIGGVLLHDLGKVIELSGPIIPKYTVEGKLIGHISLCAAEIKRVAEQLAITSEVPTLLTHMVLSHHGHLEYGSPVLPLTREALMLSMIDEMDSKMMMLEKAYTNVASGEFTERVYTVNNVNFYQPIKR